MSRGYFGIGIWHTKTAHNVGTLWRSAELLGAAFVFTVGRRYKHQSSDTMKAIRRVPLYHYDAIEDLVRHLPFGSPLIGIEMGEASVPIDKFRHPDRCVYLLGAEDHGLTPEMVDRCHYTVSLPGAYSLNVAVAGSLVMYDRAMRRVAA